MKYANHVKISRMVAIRTAFCTNCFWNKSKYCVYLISAPSLLLHFFWFTLYNIKITSSSSLFYSCLSIRDYFDEVLPFISILSSCIAIVCWFLCKSCNSIFPSEFLPASASFSLHFTKHYQFLQIVSFTPRNVTKILQFLLYNCIKEPGTFSYIFQAGYSRWSFWLSKVCTEAFSNTTS